MITHERLLELLIYNPETGEFRRRKTGKLCGSIHTEKNGYKRVEFSVENGLYRVHRLAWFYMTGKWPSNVDHIDMDATNNKWSNLREATKSQNCFNRGPQRNNSSGYKNVFWHKLNKKWSVIIQIQGKLKHFGYYEDLELANLVACKVRDSIEGEFARHVN